jgi:acetyl/propionyl-CoA carboxylase alpha subunit
MSRPPQRQIKRLLIANRFVGARDSVGPALTTYRGEIATRIISSARELDIETYGLYTPGDTSHTLGTSSAIELSSASDFMNIDILVDIVTKHSIDAVHPGYGFLSESDEFSERIWKDAGAVVVGPGWGILSNTGDKLKARLLAERCKYL